MRAALRAFLVVALLPAAASAVTVQEIVALSKAGVSEPVILALIDRDKTIFPLSADQLVTLKTDGVSEAIVLAMLRSGREELPPPPAPAPAFIEPPYTEPNIPEPARGPDYNAVQVPYVVPYVVPYFVSAPGVPSRCVVRQVATSPTAGQFFANPVTGQFFANPVTGQFFANGQATGQFFGNNAARPIAGAAPQPAQVFTDCSPGPGMARGAHRRR